LEQVSERSSLIDKLQSDFKARVGYIQAKVSTLVPSQIRALRLKSETPRQPDLAHAAQMHQSRISMLETVGANPTIGTLSAIAAALKVGLKVQFVPFSEMLAWENNFSQDQFDVVKIDNDVTFLNPTLATPRLMSFVFHVPHHESFITEPMSFAGSMTPAVAIRVPFKAQPVSEPEQDLRQARVPHDTSWVTEEVLRMLVPEQAEDLVSSPMLIEQIHLTGKNNYQAPIELVAAASKSCSAKIAGAE
jgi:transcriptional regulator with XRE-family HTH domain